MFDFFPSPRTVNKPLTYQAAKLLGSSILIFNLVVEWRQQHWCFCCNKERERRLWTFISLRLIVLDKKEFCHSDVDAIKLFTNKLECLSHSSCFILVLYLWMSSRPPLMCSTMKVLTYSQKRSSLPVLNVRNERNNWHKIASLTGACTVKKFTAVIYGLS